MKADEHKGWQGLPAHERMSAVAELTLAAYHLKYPARDVQRLEKTLVHLQWPSAEF
jgi:hypothetical protein